jgi:hypothetical protein
MNVFYLNIVPYLFVLFVRFNASELGTYVADKVISQHMTAGRGGCFNNTMSLFFGESSKDLPSFAWPRSRSARFPGGIHYFCGRLPKISDETVNLLTTNEGILNGGPKMEKVCQLKVRKAGRMLVCYSS